VLMIYCVLCSVVLDVGCWMIMYFYFYDLNMYVVFSISFGICSFTRCPRKLKRKDWPIKNHNNNNFVCSFSSLLFLFRNEKEQTLILNILRLQELFICSALFLDILFNGTRRNKH
jgi:hypothetical protein